LAALYRSCDCAVFPYRAEGFVTPALEALACGRPTIVPDIGPSTDYSNAATSFLVPALHIRLPVGRTFRMKLGHALEVSEIDFCEVKVKSLMTAMRQAYECGAAERRAMGLAGARLVHGAFTWKHVAELVETQLRELDDGRSPVRHR
jgi:glycosyltransferase involved in cell wall biosynthesis